MLASVLKSRIFAVVVLLWLVAVSISAMTSSVDGSQVTGSVPNYSVILLTGVNGTEASAYSEIINQTGVAVAGVPVSYTLSVFYGYSSDTLKTGNAGVTGTSGYLHYDVPGLFKGEIFSLQERAVIDGRSYNTTSLIFSMLPNGSGNIQSRPIGDIVTVTPVVDSADHSLYSLHLWTIPGSGPHNLTVSYSVSPTFYGAIEAERGYNTGSKVLHNITFGSEATIPTPLQIYARPCFYEVNVSGNGQEYGGIIFSPLYTPAMASAISVNSMEGLSSTLIIFWPIFLAWALASSPPGEEHRFQRKLLKGVMFPSGRSNSAKFLAITAVAFAASLPLIVISQAASYVYSTYLYAITPSMTAFLGYFLSMSAICLFGAAVASLISMSGVRNRGLSRKKTAAGKIWYLGNRGLSRKKTAAGKIWYLGIFYAAFYLLFFYFTLLNINGFVLPLYKGGSGLVWLVVISDLFYPFSIEWLYGMSLTGNLLFGYPYTFNPAAYGIGLATISLLVSVWALIVLVIPFLVMRNRENRSAIGQA